MTKNGGHVRGGRRLALILVACALLVRLLVPAGWMPVAHAGTLTLNWCSGAAHAAPAEASAMLDAALAGKATPKHKPAPDQPCAFACAAQPADAAAGLDLLVPRLALADAPAPPAFTSCPGRGLAAPPPLPTGPPRLA